MQGQLSYQDHEVVVGNPEEPTQLTQWIKQVLSQRDKINQHLKELGLAKTITDADALYDLIQEQDVNDELIASVNEVCLQEIFGYQFSFEDRQLRWLYGLLCVAEKPLLADTAADMNDLLKELNAMSAQP